MQVRVKKLRPDAVIPKYAKPGDAGLDLTAVDLFYERNGVTYLTGLAFEIPYGYVGLIFPRSSNIKKSIVLSNCVGVIDSGYRGEVILNYKFRYPFGYTMEDVYTIGDRVGQMIIMPYPQIELIESEELSVTERGESGFGSTGK